jgi:uncharacterized protein
MKWKRGTSRANVEDRRGARPSGGGGLGGLGGLGGGGGLGDLLGGAMGGGGGGRGGGFPMGKAGGGAMGLVVAVVLAIAASQCSGGAGGLGSIGGASNLNPAGQVSSQDAPLDPADDPNASLADFAIFAFNDAQSMWDGIFRASNQQYETAKFVLFTGQTQTACGVGQSAMGPFYCPGDNKVYLDLSFVEELETKFKASGDFALAYVIAHEMGHHIQNVTGIERKMRQEQRGRSEEERNQLSVRLELQADCFAGIWGRDALARQQDVALDAGELDPGDFDEALNAAEAVGDDRIFKNAGMTVDSDLFTHGTSEQRKRWFSVGFRTGDPNKCNTFEGSYNAL